MTTRDIKIGMSKTKMSEEEYLAFHKFIKDRPQGPWISEAVTRYGDNLTAEQMWSTYKEMNKLKFKKASNK